MAIVLFTSKYFWKVYKVKKNVKFEIIKVLKKETVCNW